MHDIPAADRLPVLSGQEFKSNPYPAYAWLREHEPVFCRVSADGAARMWFLTRYEDVAEALRDHRRFVKDVHRTLPPEQLAVLDGSGSITLVNEAWRAFATANAAPGGIQAWLGSNYIEVCRRATDEEAEDGRRAAEGIEAVLSGNVTRFSMEYPCHSPTEKRWFLMFVAPIRDEIGGVTVSHIDVTRRKLMELELHARLAAGAGA